MEKQKFKKLMQNEEFLKKILPLKTHEKGGKPLTDEDLEEIAGGGRGKDFLKGMASPFSPYKEFGDAINGSPCDPNYDENIDKAKMKCHGATTTLGLLFLSGYVVGIGAMWAAPKIANAVNKLKKSKKK